MFSVSHVMLFLRDTFFPSKVKKEGLTLNPCAPYWTKYTQTYFIFMYIICIVLVSEQDPHRIMQSQKIQAGKEFRSSPIQPPAYSKTISEVQSCFSGLCPVGSWKPPGLETTQSLFLPLFKWRKVLLISSCCFTLGLFSFFLLPCTAVKGLTPSPQ